MFVNVINRKTHKKLKKIVGNLIEPGDIVVLAGKGHEDYQEIKGHKYPMDERVLIREILAEE